MSDLQGDLDSTYLGSFEYTFTNRELDDVLGFLERRQSGIPIEEDTSFSPVLQGPTTSLSLQFQPHPSEVEQPPFITNDTLFIPTNDPTLPQQQHPIENNTILDTDNNNNIPQQRRASSRRTTTTPPTTTTITTTTTTTKQHISHSTVEKQRRDRINALIDELRDLVPPRSTLHPHDDAIGMNTNDATSSSSRRPKHAVLADTIALVKDLQHQLSLVSGYSGGGGNNNTTTTDGSAGGAITTANTTTNTNNTTTTTNTNNNQNGLPPPPTIAPDEEGVQIDPGDGCLYVKVHCKDRHGLLSDIVRTLRSIPLEIKTAAVTTTATGNVYDIFEVVGPSTMHHHHHHHIPSTIDNNNNNGGDNNNNNNTSTTGRDDHHESHSMMDISNEESIEMIRASVEAAVLNGVVAAEKRRRHEVA